MSLFLSIKDRFLKWGKPAADTLVNALSGLNTRVTALEAGGGSGGDTLILTLNDDTSAFDKTWLEISTALDEGKRVIWTYTDSETNASSQSIVLSTECMSASSFKVWFLGIDYVGEAATSIFYSEASSENEYPVLDD